MQEWSKESSAWIAKPAASSRGRGISLVTSIEGIPDGEAVVCKYITNPLLVRSMRLSLTA